LAVRIRLAKFGRRHHPIYRIVVMDAKSPREGRYLDILGTYDPKRKVLINVYPEKVKEWVLKGVELSHRAKAILWNHGILKEVVPADYQMKRVGDYYVFEKRESKKSKGGEEA